MDTYLSRVIVIGDCLYCGDEVIAGRDSFTVDGTEDFLHGACYDAVTDED